MFLHSETPAQTGMWALKCLFNYISCVSQIEIGLGVARDDWNDENKKASVLEVV